MKKVTLEDTGAATALLELQVQVGTQTKDGVGKGAKLAKKRKERSVGSSKKGQPNPAKRIRKRTPAVDLGPALISVPWRHRDIMIPMMLTYGPEKGDWDTSPTGMSKSASTLCKMNYENLVQQFMSWFPDIEQRFYFDCKVYAYRALPSELAEQRRRELSRSSHC